MILIHDRTPNFFRTSIERLKGQKWAIEYALNGAKDSLASIKSSLVQTEKARIIVRSVGTSTQEQLSYNLQEITTMALSAVMKDPYELILEFTERRGKFECDVLFEREGERIDPYEGGGGAIDIAALALRIASWSMHLPRERNTFILDEPFKHLKGEDDNQKALDMISEISKELSLQIIMVSDEKVSREATVRATDLLIDTRLSKKRVTKIKLYH